MTAVMNWWRRQPLQRRFLVALASLMLLALLMLSVLASNLLQREVDRAVKSEMQGSLVLTQRLTEQWFANKKQQILTLAQHLSVQAEQVEQTEQTEQTASWQDMLTIGREASDYSLMYLGTSSGEFIQSNPPIDVPAGFDPRQRPWFIQAQAEHGLIVTPVYPDALTGSLTMTLAVPLQANPEYVVGGDLYISSVINDLLQQKLRWNSHLLLLDNQHNILAQADQTLKQNSLEAMLPGFVIDDSALQNVSFDDKQWLAASVQVADTGWRFLLLVDALQIQSARTELIYQLGLLAIAVLLGGGLLILWLVRALTRPIEDFQQQLKYISSTLDLSRRLETTDQAELGDLAAQTNTLLQRISSALNGVLRSSSRLTATASTLAHTAGVVSRNTGKQQEVSQSMAAAVEQMSSSVAEITSTMEELSASSTQIADHSQSVVDVANLTLESSKKGSGAMQTLQLHMTDIHADSENSLREIVQLGSKSKAISKVMDLINTLADQTKLIAFNAALEASSAGESGKRFSVVASEIRRLADSVTDSTHEIEERIQEIQDAINRLVITSEKGASSIQLGMQVSLETANDLNALVQAATKTSSAAQQISLSTRQQKTASSQVVIALRDIANASTHNAQSVRSISQISEDMLQMSDELNQLVREFKTASET